MRRTDLMMPNKTTDSKAILGVVFMMQRGCFLLGQAHADEVRCMCVRHEYHDLPRGLAL